MILNVAKKEGEMAFTKLNETSEKVMMDTLVTFKPDDYCPLFEDDFEPKNSSLFTGEVSTTPSNYNEAMVCEDFFRDEFDAKLFELVGSDADPTSEDEKMAAVEVLEKAGYDFKPIYGILTGNKLQSGQPEIRYSLEKTDGAKTYGFALLNSLASNEVAKLFIDRENGKDITLHAVNIYSKNNFPDKQLFYPTTDEDIRDEQIFGFLDNKGMFVPESELNHIFRLANNIDMQEQAKEGRDFANLPEAVKNSRMLSKIVIANNPCELEKTKVTIDQKFLEEIVEKMYSGAKGQNIKDSAIELIEAVKRARPHLLSNTAAELVRYNCISCKDLPENVKNDPQVYTTLLKKEVDLLNFGKSGNVKLTDIPSHMLLSKEVTKTIADQMTERFKYSYYQQLVNFDSLPKALQENPIILGRAVARDISLSNKVSQEMKQNPDFVESLFKIPYKENYPIIFNELYGGIDNAPTLAKEMAISEIYLAEPDVRAILETTFEKNNLDKIIIEGQKSEFGKMKGFVPNLEDIGHKHLKSAVVRMNALGEIKELTLSFDNGYIEPDGDHGGWNSTKSYKINQFEEPVSIKVPLIGHESAKKNIRLALGGNDAPKVWIPEPRNDVHQKKDLLKHLSNDDGQSMKI
jgi:hypothetical protein